MPKKHLPEGVVEVAVAVLMRGQEQPTCQCREILAVYNDKWREFTLPMTKRRRWEDRGAESGERLEEWTDAAARAVVECAGQACRPFFLLDTGKHKQSDRDGATKLYHFMVFGWFVSAEMPVVPGAIYQWLSPMVFEDKTPQAEKKSLFEATRLDLSLTRKKRAEGLYQVTLQDKTLRPISHTARFLVGELLKKKPELFPKEVSG